MTPISPTWSTTASGNALHQLRQATTIVGDLLAALVSMGAAVITAALLHPALGPLVLATAVPQGGRTSPRRRSATSTSCA